MKNIVFSILFLLSTTVIAQEVRWAAEVENFSSQFGKRQYSANQVLGKPNVLPNLGASPNAWAPKKRGKEEFIKIKFEDPIQAQQIAIAETHNPGGIHQIYAYDSEGNEYLLNSFEY